MSADRERVWVSVEVLRGQQAVAFRGTLAAADLQALLSGGDLPPFITLQNVHWVDAVRQGQQPPALRTTAYGRDGEWRWHTGTLHLRPSAIFTIAELRDCSSLLNQQPAE